MDPLSVEMEETATAPEPVAHTAHDAAPPTAPDQAPEAPAADDAGADQQVEAQAPKPKPIQKRIGELVRERETARREAEYWREQAAMMQRAPEPQQTAPQPPAELRAEDFPTYEAYLVAAAKREAISGFRQELAQQAEQAQRMAEQRQQMAAVSEFQVRADDARARYEDFDAVVTDPTTPISPIMAEAIVTAAGGHEVAYYLGRNKQEAARIANLPPLGQAMEIARLEQRLTSAVRRASSAPPPPRTVSGGAVPGRDPNSAGSYAEYVALRRAQSKPRR